MAVTLEKFVKQIEDCGIVSPGKLENFVPPKAHPKDAAELARELVKAGNLTPFQAHQVLNGKVKALYLGNYTILDTIGAGGMGQVFKAQHRRMDRLVALKMLPAKTMKDAAAVARFEREVRAAAKLRHPNIVAADDADEANGVHFLVMEYVEGRDLSALVKKNGPFAVEKAVNYTLQTARGLEFAHSEGVVHRDIKPANLLLDKKGVVKILDMGLARIETAGDAAAQAELTGTGAIMGTVDYMAPEQGVSTKDADARADIYSLGCTLHYLLLGKPVYAGETVTAKLLAHHQHAIPSLCKLRADVPAQVDTVFRKMVAKKVEDRYQTMTAVIADLQMCGASHDQSFTMQQSIVSTAENHAFTFLREAPAAATTHKPGPMTKPAPAQNGNGHKKLILGAVGAAVVGLAILAGVILSLRTKDGTLVVEIDQPDAVVQVLDAEGKVEISQPGGQGTISISVDPGKHRLKVEKDGFAVFGESFEIESGGRKSIRAELKPLKALIAQSNKPWESAAFQQWVKTVAALPAQKQVEAVAKKLMELNPGFDGKVRPKIENGLVAEFAFQADHVTDISPVRALLGMNILSCSGGVGRSGKLSDLSPLHGMKLARLEFTNTHVSDLSPLRGMPLVYLGCSETKVSDLSPLAGMKLETLGCRGTQVSDLSPLRGMPLVTLRCSRTRVSDLSPLEECQSLRFLSIFEAKVPSAGVAALQKALPNCKIELNDSATPVKHTTTFNDPAFQAWIKTVAALPAEKQVEAVSKKLMELNPGFDGKLTGFERNTSPQIVGGVVAEIGFATDKVNDISPVRALPGLNVLNCYASNKGTSQLFDLSPLQGMALNSLGCGGTHVSDLSPLGKMPLTSLWASNTEVTDLLPLQRMPLKHLNISHTKVSDLSPLQGMPLMTLECSHTSVSDLSPLKGMPLKALWLGVTQVADLSPLTGMHLTTLACDGTRVSDLSPLAGMDLTTIYITPKNITQGLDVIRRMKNLKVFAVGGIDNEKLLTDESLKRFDGGKFGKPSATFNDPAFQAWIKTVQALPAEKQTEAVAKKLQELNPGFDGKVAPKIESGILTGLEFLTDSVTDISPVRALQGLKALRCPGSYSGKGKLSDLSPLEGLRLTNLHCDSTQVFDLSPLRGMELTVLICGITRVDDLSPLEGMPLTTLFCSTTRISDLSSLKGMPLTSLRFANTQVTDLTPLKGMPLMHLTCDHTSVVNISPIEDCQSLRALYITATKIPPAAVAALQKALPNCKIDWDDPAKPKTPAPAPSATK